MSPRTRTEARKSRTQARGRRILPPDRARSAQPLDRVLLDGRRLDLQIGNRLVGARLERTMLGSNTLTLNVWDGDSAILRSGALGLRVMSRVAIVELDGLHYSVAGVGRSGETLTLTCEDQAVVRLKRHGKTKPLRASRNTTTRAAFVARMIRQAGIPVLVLDEGVRQPIAGAEKLRRELAKARRQGSESPRRGRSRTEARGVQGDLTIKGQPADSEQRRIMGEGLAAAAETKAPPRATLALLVALIQESAARNLSGGHASSTGALQFLASTARLERIDPRDTRACARVFLTKGALGRKKGAIIVARENPGFSSGQIIEAMHNPGTNLRDYDQWEDEARRWLNAGGGDLAAEESTDSGARVKQYAFERRKGESTWTAARRLLDEVQWRLFVREGVVVIASDPALMRARPSFIVGPDVEHWSPDFELHRALRVGEMNGRIAAGRYQADPGEVVRVDDLPQIEANWLLATTSVDLLTPEAPVDIALARPQQPKKEPASEIVGGGGDGTSGREAAEGGPLRERIIAEARKTMSARTGHNWYLAGGTQTASQLANPTPRSPFRSDCSQWVHAIYLKAGAPSPGLTSGQQAVKGRRTTTPRPGDLVLDAPTGARHVELYIGNGKTIGHGSKPIDEWTVDGMRGFYGGVFFVTYDFLDREG